MATQMKLHKVQQWHYVHRLLVCRLFHQQINSVVEIANQGNNKQTCMAGRTQPYTTTSRQFTQYLTRDTYMSRQQQPSSTAAACHHHTVLLRHVSTGNGVEQNKRRKKGFKISPLELKSSRYVMSPTLASLMVDKIWNGEDITSGSTQGLIIDAKPGQ